ncbi:MAG: endonuclease/exonuclease/phosphatase family protein, partial [bacterium]
YHNCAPDIICLQETWQIPNIELLSIPNYFPLECLVRHNNLQGGGVGMYFRETVQYRILKEQSVMFDKVYESIFAEVITSSKKKYLIGSIYRPGNHSNMTQSDQFTQFIELFANSLSDLTEIYERIYLFGDFNIDILKYSVSSQVAEYIDLLFSFGFL